MLERMKDLPAGIDGFRAKGKVTEADYAESLHPMLEQARSEGRRVRFLYEFGPEFEGFTAGAAWQDARMGMHYLRLFERCAVVTDIGWMSDVMNVIGTMMPCPVRVFKTAERAAAIDWLASPPAVNFKSYLAQDKGVLVVEPQGPLTREDFEALGAIVDPWIESHGELRGLVLHVRKFPGWENLGGVVRHIRFVKDHHRKLHRLAFASDIALSELGTQLADHFVKAEVKHFAYDEIDNAIVWATTK